MEGRSGFRKAKTYGKKASSFSKINTSLFAADSPPAQKASVTTKAITTRHKALIFPSPSIELPDPQPLTDVTNRLDKICLNDQERTGIKTKGKGEEVQKTQAPRATRSATAASTGGTRADSKFKWLEPLTKVYTGKGRKELTLQRWQDVLSDSWSVVKIAESSYAEIFKISNDQGSSVLKLMALKPPTGRGSRRETAVTADSIVSEVFIMDLMADIPGFLEFKEAWIIEGQPSPQIIEAFEKFETVQESEFTNPSKYPKDQVFLALELGDAGIDIEHFQISRLSQIWDVFLKITAALAIGEREYAFEHRDLHDGNVCVRQVGRVRDFNSDYPHKFGYSGLEVTLLDYTLSRAHDQLGFVAYRDLEEDRGLFAPSESLQSEIYQRMRAWNCFSAQYFKNPKLGKNTKAPKGAWQNFNPYSNVLWIYYIFNFLMTKYKGDESLDEFMEETKTLRKRLDPDTPPSRGSFDSACNVLKFCEEEGWITQAESLNPAVDDAAESV